MDPATVVSVVLNLVAIAILVSVLLVCLKIKTTKKTPELLGTVGTVKTFDDDGLRPLHPESPSSLNVSKQLNMSHNSTGGPQVILPPPLAPSPASLGNPASAGHSPAPSPYNMEHNRTPSRAGERKLPEIPQDSDNGSTSELYDTLGPPPQNRENSDSETETDGARANHPYARVKKRKPREHPYATVSEHLPNRSSLNDDGTRSHSSKDDHGEIHLAPPPPTVHPPPPPPPENAAQTHFSGDSQDSSKGYTSISVREPLCHIQPAVVPRSSITVPSRQNANATYMAVSEASDDMYAAIEDPTYIPTGAVSQTNSDTYAVINPPDYDSGSQTYQKLEGQDEEEDDPSSPLHTYSKIDKSKKKRAAAPPPPLPPPPIHPGVSAGPQRPISFNVDEMYAKIQKSPPPRPDPNDSLPVGASALRSTPRSARVRSAHWEVDESSHRIQRGEVNYSDYEVSHYDKSQRPMERMSVMPPPVSPKFLRQQNSSEHVSGPIVNNLDVGYEIVPEPDATTRIEGGLSGSLPRNEHGFQQVVGDWLRRPPGSANFQFEAGTDDQNRLRDHGYEVVQEPDRLIGYPHNHRHLNLESEPPYAVLSPQDDEESEEGYETIPASERRSAPGRKDSNEEDPGYESVRKKGSVISYGYEKIAGGKPVNRRWSSKRDPGYETVKESPGFQDHDYETVPGTNKKVSTATDYGYETVDNLQRRFDEFETVPELELRSLPPTSHARRSAPAPLPPVTQHPPAGRSISLSPKLGSGPVPLSPSVRMSIGTSMGSVPPMRPPRRSSVTVIELRSDSRQSSPSLGSHHNDNNDDDDTVHSGGEGTEINTHIFV